MNRTKIGIIGCGNICQVYMNDFVQIYADRIEVAALADVVPQSARDTAAKFGVPVACTPEELLRMDEIEIVVNLTIPAAHVAVNLAILEAGKHVYCEKPLALSTEDVQRVLDFARARNLRVACAPDTFLGPALQTCRKLIDDGWIGRPFAATANMVEGRGPESWHPAPHFFYQKGGGPLMDMGPYYVAAMVALLGPVDRVQCFAEKTMEKRMIFSQPHRGAWMDVEVFTHYSANLRLHGGVLVDMNMSFDVWQSSLPIFEVYGTEGTLHVPHPADFTGKIRMMRANRMIDRWEGRAPVEDAMQLFDVPAAYSGTVGNRRGIGVVDLAGAIGEGRAHRLDEAFVYHCTEVLLAFDQSAEDGAICRIASSCERPEPLPVGLDIARV